MTDYFEKAKRPRVPPATADITKQHHEWLAQVTDELLHLREQVKELVEDNKELKGDNNEKQKKIEELEKTVSELEKRPVATQAVSFSAIMKEEASKPSAGMANLLWQVRQESADVQHRSKNLVAFGIAKSAIEELDARKAHHTKEVNELLEHLKVVATSVQRIHRMKAGAVVIEFKDLKDRLKALKAAKNLRGHTKFDNVFISPDLTPAERVKQKEELAKCKERNERLPKDESTGKVTGSHYFGMRNGHCTRVNI